MQTTLRTAILFLVAPVLGLALNASLAAQERVLTAGLRTHTDPSFSPDGVWVAYQALGKLHVKPAAGGIELTAFDAGQQMTYLWQANSASLLVFSKDELFQTSRDGGTTRRLAKLDGKGVSDFFFIGPTQTFVYGVRRVGFKTFVIRVRLGNGALEDLITVIPGVSSVDVDPSGKKLLITATEFLFTYRFFTADLDGKNVVTLNTKALASVTNHGRWLDDGKNFVFSHTGAYAALHSGFQVWQMAVATGTARPLGWMPHQVRGVPMLSSDRKSIVIPEHRPGLGTSRAVILPADGGGLTLLSDIYFQMGDRIRWSPNGKSVVYVGHPQRNKGADVRLYDLSRLTRLAPAVRPGKVSQVTLPLNPREVGAMFMGFGLAKTPITLPGLKGQFELDLVKGLFVLGSGANSELKLSFGVPNDNKLIGLPIYVQGLRVLFGGASGDFPRPMVVPIVPN